MDPKTRLRKACDACSIRKVKVGVPPQTLVDSELIFDASVIQVALLVGHAPLWIFRVLMSGLADVEALQIAMRRL